MLTDETEVFPIDPEVAQLITAIAAKELGLASLLNSIAHKIDRLSLQNVNSMQVLAELRAMSRDVLSAVSEIERVQSNTLSFILQNHTNYADTSTLVETKTLLEEALES